MNARQFDRGMQSQPFPSDDFLARQLSVMALQPGKFTQHPPYGQLNPDAEVFRPNRQSHFTKEMKESLPLRSHKNYFHTEHKTVRHHNKHKNQSDSTEQPQGHPRSQNGGYGFNPPFPRGYEQIPMAIADGTRFVGAQYPISWGPSYGQGWSPNPNLRSDQGYGSMRGFRWNHTNGPHPGQDLGLRQEQGPRYVSHPNPRYPNMGYQGTHKSSGHAGGNGFD